MLTQKLGYFQGYMSKNAEDDSKPSILGDLGITAAGGAGAIGADYLHNSLISGYAKKNPMIDGASDVIKATQDRDDFIKTLLNNQRTNTPLNPDDIEKLHNANKSFKAGKYKVLSNMTGLGENSAKWLSRGARVAPLALAATWLLSRHNSSKKSDLTNDNRPAKFVDYVESTFKSDKPSDKLKASLMLMHPYTAPLWYTGDNLRPSAKTLNAPNNRNIELLNDPRIRELMRDSYNQSNAEMAAKDYRGGSVGVPFEEYEQNLRDGRVMLR
jgi:hypothetical protein